MKSSALYANQQFVKALGQRALDWFGLSPRDSAQLKHEPYPADITLDASEPLPLASVHSQNRELMRIRASRWVDLFPDELIVQEKTVSIVRHTLFVSEAETLPVKDIGRVVFVDTPFFDGLRILGKNVAHDLHIKGLYRKDALHAKDVIEGLLLEENDSVHIPTWLSNDERSEVLADNASHTHPGDTGHHYAPNEDKKHHD